LDKGLQRIDRFGIDKNKVPRNLSIALGTHAMTPLELAQGYSVFANGGYKVEPFFVERVEDADGNLLHHTARHQVCTDCDNQSLASHVKPAQRVIDEQTAYIMDDLLKDVVRRGTATAAKKLNRADIAGKTGTTNGPTDVWFSGYGGNITGTAWIGFDQNTNLGRKEFGGTAALPIWIAFMEQALAGQPEVVRAQPAGLVTTKINPDTGNRAEAGEPDTVFEYFKAGNGPEVSPANNPNTRSQQQLPDDLF
jgi:penicillin-binding protein 1A